MIEEILDMGFKHVELGYDLRHDLVPGVQHMVKENAVTVNSVHNFCPIPLGAPKGHPELFTFASTQPHIRESAVRHTVQTIQFAAEIGASTVISHSGNVEMERLTKELIGLIEQNDQFSSTYERTKLKLQVTREKKIKKQLSYLYESLEKLLPVLEENKICLALENLPTWEAIPTEKEIMDLIQDFNSPHLQYWHDIGHGQIRENLGLINQERWLERLHPYLAGMHLHDVAKRVRDHVMPPLGGIDFSLYKRFVTSNILKVIEPSPGTPSTPIIKGIQHLKQVWRPV